MTQQGQSYITQTLLSTGYILEKRRIVNLEPFKFVASLGPKDRIKYIWQVLYK